MFHPTFLKTTKQIGKMQFTTITWTVDHKIQIFDAVDFEA